MDLNKGKCGILKIKRRLNKNGIYETINGIPQVKQYKYLGIILDEKLDFKEHLKYIKTKTM
jgi:hypothetical protein